MCTDVEVERDVEGRSEKQGTIGGVKEMKHETEEK